MIEICRDETDFHLGVADKLFDVKKTEVLLWLLICFEPPFDSPGLQAGVNSEWTHSIFFSGYSYCHNFAVGGSRMTRDSCVYQVRYWCMNETFQRRSQTENRFGQCASSSMTIDVAKCIATTCLSVLVIALHRILAELPCVTNTDTVRLHKLYCWQWLSFSEKMLNSNDELKTS